MAAYSNTVESGSTLLPLDFMETQAAANAQRTAKELTVDPGGEDITVSSGQAPSFAQLLSLRIHTSYLVMYSSFPYYPWAEGDLTAGVIKARHLQEVRECIEDSELNQRCGDNCHNSCAHTCGTICTGACSNSCNTGCGNGCQGCYGTCRGTFCTTDCPCANICSMNCGNTCYNGACSNTCDNTCKAHCTATCFGTCYTACNLACTVGCAGTHRLSVSPGAV